MAWETRNGRGRYYTRSRRVDGRVMREYVGTGPGAELAAERDRRDRAERAERRRADREARRALTEQDAPLAALHGAVDALTGGALVAAGFHRHRGEWRRRRG